MKRLQSLFVPALALLLLSGCAELFEVNLLAAFEPTPEIPTLDALDSQETAAALNSLNQSLQSPKFINQLKANPEQTAVVKSYLKGKFSTAPAPGDTKARQDYQLAAILYADLSVRASRADEAVNRVFGELLSGDVAFDNAGSVSGLVRNVLPSQEEGDVIALISGLLDAHAAYESLSSTLSDADLSVPFGVNIGGAAQTALVAFMVGSAADSASGTQEEKAEAIYQWVVNDDTSGFDGGEAPELDDPAEDDGLSKILDAAGLGDLLDSLGGGGD